MRFVHQQPAEWLNLGIDFFYRNNEPGGYRETMLKILRIIIIPFLVIFTGCAFYNKLKVHEPNNLEKLRSELNKIFDDPEFFNANWGVAIQSLKTGEYIYLKNENKNFAPASNMKLFTTAAALIKLTPKFQFCTTIYQNGQISEDGILEGDLVIRGSGDPSINNRYHDSNITYIFETWADSLKQIGVNAINGNIIGDDNYFEDEIMGEGWAWDYQSDWFAAQISAFSFNDNCMNIVFSAGDSVGLPVKFKLEPVTDYVEIVNKVVTVEHGLQNGIYYNRKRGTNRVEISGALPIDFSDKRGWFSVENPTLFAATVLKQTLEKKEILVNGIAKDIDDYDDYSYSTGDQNKLFNYFSPPLWQIVETINKNSQNLYAELILRTLGAEFKDEGSAQKSIEVVKEVLTSMAINPDNFNMVDGSGLSRLNLVTPKHIITLLRYMKNHPVNEFFYNSLPIAGIDGTLKRRLKNSSTRGNVKAKTGYLGNVVALSGYLTTGDDEELVFSIMTNNYTVPTTTAHAVQDLVCERLTNFSRN